MSQKSAVQYVKQDEPAFIKRFKEKVGYKEEPAIDAKRQKLESADEGGDCAVEDEKPVVVVLQPGDLTADEAEQMNCNAGRDPGTIHTDKIVFRKPSKKAVVSEAGSSTSQQPPSGGDDSADASSSSKGRKEPATKKEFSSKAVKNSSLLSFADDEDA